MSTHAEHSADSQYEVTPPGAGYEHTDASVSGIVKFIVWLTIAAIVIHIGIALLFTVFVQQRVEHAAPRYPLAAALPDRLPPEPRLQRFPREDIQNFRLAEEAVLGSYGWVDKGAGVVHIPITEAMRLVLERGLPTRRAGTPAAMPGSMPSDASAGRTTEKRRQ